MIHQILQTLLYICQCSIIIPHQSTPSDYKQSRLNISVKQMTASLDNNICFVMLIVHDKKKSLLLFFSFNQKTFTILLGNRVKSIFVISLYFHFSAESFSEVEQTSASDGSPSTGVIQFISNSWTDQCLRRVPLDWCYSVHLKQLNRPVPQTDPPRPVLFSSSQTVEQTSASDGSPSTGVIQFISNSWTDHWCYSVHLKQLNRPVSDGSPSTGVIQFISNSWTDQCLRQVPLDWCYSVHLKQLNRPVPQTGPPRLVLFSSSQTVEQTSASDGSPSTGVIQFISNSWTDQCLRRSPSTSVIQFISNSWTDQCLRRVPLDRCYSVHLKQLNRPVPQTGPPRLVLFSSSQTVEQTSASDGSTSTGVIQFISNSWTDQCLRRVPLDWCYSVHLKQLNRPVPQTGPPRPVLFSSSQTVEQTSASDGSPSTGVIQFISNSWTDQCLRRVPLDRCYSVHLKQLNRPVPQTGPPRPVLFSSSQTVEQTSASDGSPRPVLFSSSQTVEQTSASDGSPSTGVIQFISNSWTDQCLRRVHLDWCYSVHLKQLNRPVPQTGSPRPVLFSSSQTVEQTSASDGSPSTGVIQFISNSWTDQCLRWVHLDRCYSVHLKQLNRPVPQTGPPRLVLFSSSQTVEQTSASDGSPSTGVIQFISNSWTDQCLRRVPLDWCYSVHLKQLNRPVPQTGSPRPVLFSSSQTVEQTSASDGSPSTGVIQFISNSWTDQCLRRVHLDWCYSVHLKQLNRPVPQTGSPRLVLFSSSQTVEQTSASDGSPSTGVIQFISNSWTDQCLRQVHLDWCYSVHLKQLNRPVSQTGSPRLVLFSSSQTVEQTSASDGSPSTGVIQFISNSWTDQCLRRVHLDRCYSVHLKQLNRPVPQTGPPRPVLFSSSQTVEQTSASDGFTSTGVIQFISNSWTDQCRVPLDWCYSVHLKQLNRPVPQTGPLDRCYSVHLKQLNRPVSQTGSPRLVLFSSSQTVEQTSASDGFTSTGVIQFISNRWTDQCLRQVHLDWCYSVHLKQLNRPVPQTGSPRLVLFSSSQTVEQTSASDGFTSTGVIQFISNSWTDQCLRRVPLDRCYSVHLKQLNRPVPQTGPPRPVLFSSSQTGEQTSASDGSPSTGVIQFISNSWTDQCLRRVPLDWCYSVHLKQLNRPVPQTGPPRLVLFSSSQTVEQTSAGSTYL